MTAAERKEQAAKAQKEKQQNKKAVPGLFEKLKNSIFGDSEKQEEAVIIQNAEVVNHLGLTKLDDRTSQQSIEVQPPKLQES